MNETRKFRVLKDFTLVLGTSIVVRRFKKGEIFDYNHMINIDDLLSDSTIEEILPDKKPNLSDRILTEEFANNLKQMNDVLNGKHDSILDYEKKYNMWDATHLMKNHDVKMIDSRFGFVWEYYSEYNTLWTSTFDKERNDSCDCFIEDLFDESFGYIDSLDLTFTLVKPVEEVKEEWVKIENFKELCSAISKSRVIKLGNSAKYKTYDNETIEYLYEHLKNKLYPMSYLEE